MADDHFFIVGAQRCGTTYLSRMLNAHPEIEMAQPARPEPKYFLGNDADVLGRNEYEKRYFSAEREILVRGEKSTSYIESELAAARIARMYPEARILMILRNPVARAISNYAFSVSEGVEKADIREALMHEEARGEAYDRRRFSASPFAYLRRGHYVDYLEMWQRYFARSRVDVLIFERVIGDLGAVQEVYRSLGVSGDFTPTGASKKINASNQEEYPVSEDLRNYLVDHFREANAKLAKALDDDLQEWE